MINKAIEVAKEFAKEEGFAYALGGVIGCLKRSEEVDPEAACTVKEVIALLETLREAYFDQITKWGVQE